VGECADTWARARACVLLLRASPRRHYRFVTK
jgi:hypothetical protein